MVLLKKFCCIEQPHFFAAVPYIHLCYAVFLPFILETLLRFKGYLCSFLTSAGSYKCHVEIVQAIFSRGNFVKYT